MNALLTPLFLTLLFICGRAAWPHTGGYLAVLLFASVPLLAMNVNGAGFELLNLVMILGAAIAAKSYYESPNATRLNTLVLLGLLLAQTRYESVLYVVPVGLIALLGWWKVRRFLISKVVICAPLLLIPYPLQQRIFSDYPALWQLKDGAERPFLLRLIPDNLSHASNYFFNLIDAQQPNSFLLSLLFVGALTVALIFGVRWLRRVDLKSPVWIAALSFGAIICANFLLLMAYHWGQLDDIVAKRIVLPFLLLQVLVVVLVGGQMPRSRFVGRILLGLTVLFICGVTLPVCGRSDFLKWVPDQHKCLWLQAQVQAREGEHNLYVSNQHLVVLAEREPAIYEIEAKRHKARLALHHELVSYDEILFMHEMAVDSTVEGGLKHVTPLGQHYDLELIEATKLNRNTYMCVSRLRAVKWLEGEARSLDMTLLPALVDGPEKLLFYAQTLP